MRIQLAKCREQPCPFELTLDPAAGGVRYDELSEPPQVEAAGRVEWRGHGKFAVVGELRARVKSQCVRCLEPTGSVLERPFDLTFVPASSLPSVGEAEIDAGEELAYDGSYEGDELELDPIVAEQFHLAIPMRFLCSEDCPGLCPQCGARRRPSAPGAPGRVNEAACDCRPPVSGTGPERLGEAEGDPRLAVLKSLLRH